MVKDIKISDFDYNLPEERIPLHPLEKRDECKLLVRDSGGKIYHRRFKELPDLLPPGSLLVCNDTKVINARLLFHKETGAAIELFLLEPVSPSDYALNFQSHRECVWKCLVGNSKKWKEGEISMQIVKWEGDIVTGYSVYATRLKVNEDGSSDVKFSWYYKDATFGRIVDDAGKIPIPPYLNRESEVSDLQDYQTIYANIKGSVAAPTAGLHFTSGVFENLEAHAVKVAKVTLHVGAGTFRPVKSEKIGNHPMHSEPFSVSRQLIEILIEWKSKGQPIVATGTTTVRTLESLPFVGSALINNQSNPFQIRQWVAYEGEDFDTIESLKAIRDYLDREGLENLRASTAIMIAPGFKWRLVDAMVTNFHQPKSTLLLLVSSFIGGDDWRDMYESALNNDYRFLSYGDASLLLRPIKN